MRNRGPILMLFSALLILSPLVIRSVQIANDGANQRPTVGFVTSGDERDRCEASTFRTASYAFGCGANRDRDSDRRRNAGGSVSVRVN